MDKESAVRRNSETVFRRTVSTRRGLFSEASAHWRRKKAVFAFFCILGPATAWPRRKTVSYCRVPRQRKPVSLFYALFFFSGCAGLGYQMIWSKMFATGLGHEMPAALAIVC